MTSSSPDPISNPSPSPSPTKQGLIEAIIDVIVARGEVLKALTVIATAVITSYGVGIGTARLFIGK